MTEPPKERIVRVTVDLPESVHRELSSAASKHKKSKAFLLRLGLKQVLADLNTDQPVS
jgi:hypothetical protein